MLLNWFNINWMYTWPLRLQLNEKNIELNVFKGWRCKHLNFYVFFSVAVLLQLASEALPNDMTLSLAYLLALPQVCSQIGSAFFATLISYLPLVLHMNLIPFRGWTYSMLQLNEKQGSVILGSKEISKHNLMLGCWRKKSYFLFSLVH